MPIHLPAQSRRQFLITVGAGLVACSTTAFGRESESESDLVYLLNDTHIGEKHPAGLTGSESFAAGGRGIGGARS